MEYVNRKDDTYYLHQGTTKTGKPKYYGSRKAPDVPVEAMPDGYEWRENPETAVVSVRKIRPTRVAAFEKEMLDGGLRQAELTAFLIDIADDSLVVYLSDTNPKAVEKIFDSLFGGRIGDPAAMGEWTTKHVHYSPMMRFELVDEDERLFRVDRWCFRGSIDDWLFLEAPLSLEKAIAKYVPHLGQESFYELM